MRIRALCESIRWGLQRKRERRGREEGSSLDQRGNYTGKERIPSKGKHGIRVRHYPLKLYNTNAEDESLKRSSCIINPIPALLKPSFITARFRPNSSPQISCSCCHYHLRSSGICQVDQMCMTAVNTIPSVPQRQI